ncbi:MAG: DUF177 domain-containing protein [Candidatus Zixiibacteriota bacterium]
MILNLRDFKEFPAHVFLRGDPQQLAMDYESVRGVDSVAAELDIQKSGEEFYCQGRVTAAVRLECARCLGEFAVNIGNNTDFIICSEDLYRSRSEKATDDEDYAFFQGADLQADISDVVRQAIILSIGLKPLCSENCRGLCPVCGANRNETACTCRQEAIDPRWEALQRFRNTQRPEERNN